MALKKKNANQQPPCMWTFPQCHLWQAGCSGVFLRTKAVEMHLRNKTIMWICLLERAWSLLVGRGKTPCLGERGGFLL